MIKELIRYVFILICLFIVFWFIYPTPYVYTIYEFSEVDRPAKINRFNGEGFIWRPGGGWEKTNFDKDSEK